MAIFTAGVGCRRSSRRAPTSARQLARARRPFTEPERDGRRRSPCILDADLAGLDAADAPRGISEQKDVAGDRLDGEVLVDGADPRPVGLEHDVVVGVVGDGAAGGERGEARAPPSAQPPVDRVAVKQRARASPAGGDPLGEHVDHAVEVGAGEVGVGPRAPAELVERVFIPFLAGGGGDDLLRQHVERRVRADDRVDVGPPAAARTSAAHSTSWSRVSGKRRPLGVAARAWPERPIRCRPVAMERGEPIRQTSSTAPTSMPSSSEAVATTTLSSPAFNRRSARWPSLARQAAVVGRDAVDPEALAECSVTRSTRRRVLTNTSVDRCSRASAAIAIVELRPLLVRRDRAELVLRHLDARSRSRRWPTSTRFGAGRVPPTRSRDATSIGRTVADRPMRCAAARPNPALRL